MDLQQRGFETAAKNYRLSEHPYTKFIINLYDNIKKNIKTDRILSEIIDIFQSTCLKSNYSIPKGEISSILEMRTYLAALNAVEKFLDENRQIIRITTIEDLESLVRNKII